MVAAAAEAGVERQLNGVQLVRADAIRKYVETQEWQIAEIEQGLRDADAGDLAGTDEVAAVFDKWSGAD